MSPNHINLLGLGLGLVLFGPKSFGLSSRVAPRSRTLLEGLGGRPPEPSGGSGGRQPPNGGLGGAGAPRDKVGSLGGGSPPGRHLFVL